MNSTSWCLLHLLIITVIWFYQQYYLFLQFSSIPNRNNLAGVPTNFRFSVFESLFKYYKKDALILIYNTGWAPMKSYGYCNGRFDMGSFRLTGDRADLDKADIVIFHHPENRRKIPKRTKPDQIWIWFNLEPPKNIDHFIYANNVFNLTASFRFDSDISVPYGYFLTKPDNYTFTYKTHKNFSQKTKLVSWFVHDWEENSLRVKYYNNLKNYLNVDIYGRYERVKDMCSVVSDYKFYLSFENSNVTHYITEKLWRNAFICGAVPVVLGTVKETYLKLGTPPDAFIHVDDFPNEKSLADYLKKVGENEVLYNSYLKWRKGHGIYSHETMASFFCKIVEYLNHHNVKPRPGIPNLYEWFIS
ncbi:Alpha-(1,3)-fucosyltransferase [Tritrichomonas foetus]|uniref:Fucosyltransferase n=1 Tax=Tritrichomonas foetus TaxID=1144522 RepID=A0A1J4KJU0_9EUKA|nr:Alpha-(1,3)-fucosyltransferase [Tritrichomonas foetus]|eukprot:OHT11491.1 Alpha-(1,3)-fucosyltransferase [Tritrichomonas foetus]